MYYTDKPVVVCAPTGGGKTVVFELAIIRLLELLSSSVKRSFKIVYSEYQVIRIMQCIYTFVMPTVGIVNHLLCEMWQDK